MFAQYETSRDNLRLPDCWYAPDNHCSPHFHSSIEITYVLAGHLSCSVGGHSFAASANQLIICPSYSLHWYETCGASNTLVLTFPTEFVPSLQNLLKSQTFASPSIQLGAKNDILPCITQLEQLVRQGDANRILLKGYLYTIMGLLCEQIGLVPIRSFNSPELNREILLYLQQAYLQPITAEDTAVRFGYSKSRFCHLFSEAFGMGFAAYLNILRCRHAAALLQSGSCPLIEVAMSSGYDNIRTFYRNFKIVFGVTPTQYTLKSAV